MTPTIRNIILFGGIGLALVFLYFTFVKKEPEAETSLVVSPATNAPYAPITATQPGSAPAVTSEFLSLLLNIKSIKLDDSIFKDPAFTVLRDSSIILIQDTPEGRPNPFAPIGSDSSQSSTSTSTAEKSPGSSR